MVASVLSTRPHIAPRALCPVVVNIHDQTRRHRADPEATRACAVKDAFKRKKLKVKHAESVDSKRRLTIRIPSLRERQARWPMDMTSIADALAAITAPPVAPPIASEPAPTRRGKEKKPHAPRPAPYDRAARQRRRPDVDALAFKLKGLALHQAEPQEASSTPYVAPTPVLIPPPPPFGIVEFIYGQFERISRVNPGDEEAKTRRAIVEWTLEDAPASIASWAQSLPIFQ